MGEVLDNPGTALAVVPASAVSTIVAADTNDILGKLAAKVAAHEPDVTTPRGRREIASLAADVASSKMDLIRLGKGLTETWRKSTSAVNAECKVIEERLDALKVQVRAPLAEFESREARRAQAHEDALSNMQEIACVCDDGGVLPANVDAAYGHLSAAHARDWEEFGQRAERTYRDALAKLDTCKASVQARDAAAAEASRVQAEREEAARQEAARIQVEREARIAEEAAERAKQEAERRAVVEAQAIRDAAEIEQRRQEAEAQAAADRAEAERRRIEQEAQAAAERAEIQLQREERARRHAEESAAAAERARIAAEEKAAREAIEAQRASETARVAALEKAARDNANAISAERRRVAAAAEAERAETQRRADDKAHRAKINREALAAIILAMSEAHSGTALEAEAVAKTIVAAIAGGKVPHTTLAY
jgi:hypothetical protein